MYGKCVAANYQNAKKDMCAKEFMVLKNCYLVCTDALSSKISLTMTAESSRQKVVISPSLA